MKKTIFTILIAICCNIMFGQSNAVHFSGTNSSINIGATIGNGLRTVEMMFRPSVNIDPSITDDAYALVVRNDGEIGEFGMYIKGHHWPPAERGYLGFFIRDNGVLREVYSTSNAWTANTWYHVAVTIDANSGMKLYVNGALESAIAAQTNPTMTKTEITTFGTWGDANVPRRFKGDLDEVKFWNRALLQSEIQANQCSVLNPTNETGLVGYWHFEEGTGSVTNEEMHTVNDVLTNVSWVNSNNCLAPTISIASNDADNSICNGSSITFNSTVTNAGSSPIYQWQVNGNNVGSNQSSYTTNNLQNTDVVACIVNPGSNSATSNAITVQVNPLPNISLASSQEICPNTTITLDAGAGTNYSYNWSNNLGNSQTAIVNSTGTYVVTVTNVEGCSSTASAIINNSPLCTTILCNSNNVYTYLPTAITCYQVSGATQYQFKYEQLDATNNIVRTSVTPQSAANGAYISSAVPAICYNAHYLVSVHVLKNGIWGPYSTPCNINVGQPRNVLGHGYCGIDYSNLTGQMCAGSTTSFATKFRFKFVNVNGSSTIPPSILESTADCAALINATPHLLYNQDYIVSYSTFVPYWDAVSGTVVYDWSPYGPECNTSINDPRNGPNQGYCGKHYTTLTNQIYSTETIALALKYRLTFTRLDVIETLPHIAISPNAVSTNIPLSLLDIPLTLNASYSVTISSLVPYDLDANGDYTNYIWSPEGAPCKITTGNVYARYGNNNDTEIANVLSSNSKISIYPNPAKDMINISSESEITKIELFNYNGSLIKILNSNREGVNFSDVAKGLYFIVITTKEGLYRERIIKE